MKATATGDCFVVALTLAREIEAEGDVRVCHGRPVFKGEGGYSGERFWHAWVEVGGEVEVFGRMIDATTVYDRSNGLDAELPRQLYYAIGRIGEDGEVVHRYTPEEATIESLRTGHWGPWADGAMEDPL